MSYSDRLLESRPWNRNWWHKERVEVALLQLASLSNQRKIYSGWESVLYLAGANITAFLVLCSEIWDEAAKLDIDPLHDGSIPPQVQTRGIRRASDKWRDRDRDDRRGGRYRYAAVNRLATAIARVLLDDYAISNPGHTGFSLNETQLIQDAAAQPLEDFLFSCVNWAILEERRHTSKLGEGRTRKKYYVHPLLSPVFNLPHKRVKEPIYVHVDTAVKWLTDDGPIDLRAPKATRNNSQQMILGEDI